MSALVTGEPDMVEPPMRRLTLTTISGVMIAILVAAVFAVVGLLKGGGGDGWRTEGALVVEEGTGARYVNVDGTLHPVLNYASGVLATGATEPVAAQEVSRSDLRSTARGALVGVPGLPDTMPEAEDLLEGPVTVCSTPRTDGIDVRAHVSVTLGSSPAALLDADEGVYVRDVDGETSLLLEGRRMAVARDVEAALQIDQTPTTVGTAFLDALPQGPAFASPRLPQMGRQVTLGGTTARIGQVVEVDDGTFRVVLGDGLARISDVQAKLLRAARLYGLRRAPLRLSLAEVLDAGEGRGLGEAMAGLPTEMPRLASAERTAAGVCAVQQAGGGPARFAAPEQDDVDGPATTESPTSAGGRADEVSVPPGAGMLAGSSRARGAYYIGAPGLVYAAASVEALGGFGYARVEPVVLPEELLSILPAGPAMDPRAARQPVS